MDKQLRWELEMVHDKVCDGLGDSKRVMILYLLADGPQFVHGIATALDLPQPTVSRHLKILRECFLVKATRQASSVSYSLADRRIIQALDLMRGMLHERLVQQARLVEKGDLYSEKLTQIE